MAHGLPNFWVYYLGFMFFLSPCDPCREAGLKITVLSTSIHFRRISFSESDHCEIMPSFSAHPLSMTLSCSPSFGASLRIRAPAEKKRKKAKGESGKEEQRGRKGRRGGEGDRGRGEDAQP